MCSSSTSPTTRCRRASAPTPLGRSRCSSSASSCSGWGCSGSWPRPRAGCGWSRRATSTRPGTTPSPAWPTAAQLDVALSAATVGPRAGSVALVLLDLDRFREVNDTLGHGRGDEVVLEMAQRLTRLAGPNDLVARLGGDEFAVLLPDVDGVEAALRARGGAARGAARAGPRSAASTSSWTRGPASRCTRWTPTDGPALLRHADVAAEQAKRTHVGVCAYDGRWTSTAPSGCGLLADLARAHRRGRAGAALPAQVRPVPAGCSASRRWSAGQHPQRGLLPPAEFVQVAERTGLMHPLTESVLDQALAQVRRWLDDGPRAAGGGQHLDPQPAAAGLRRAGARLPWGRTAYRPACSGWRSPRPRSWRTRSAPWRS